MKKLLLFLLLIPSLVFGEDIQKRVYERALLDVNVVYEYTNRNDHPRIDQYLRNTGVPLGSPYCASAVFTWYKEGSYISNTQNPLKIQGSASAIKTYTNCLANPMRWKIIKPRLVKLKSESIQLSDIVIWDSGAGKGHEGIAIEQLLGYKFRTIEANTSSSNILSEQREQTKNSKNKGGVYYKTRGLDDSPKFRLLGFLRAR